jgi:C1A family cysteine protease
MLEALHHKAVTYLRCKSLDDIKASIADGFPVIGGFTCYESLDSDAVSASGDVPLPTGADAEIGGHCIYFDGYDDAAGMLGFQNSWGTSWGKAGCGRLPYGYVTQGLADDFWTIRRETLA